MAYSLTAVKRYQATPKGIAARRRQDAKPHRRRRSPEERERRKWAQVFTIYGVTKTQYDAQLAAQGGHCFFCGSTSLHIDHDHKTKRFRGLLCMKHNTALGTLGDNEAGLRRALEYVVGHG